MAQAKQGDRVRVHYTGSLENGQVFDSTAERGAYEFTLGKGECLPGLDEAITGMEAGTSQSLSVPAEKGFGERREDRVVKLANSEVPEHVPRKEGLILSMSLPDGPELVVQVAAVDEESITLDANHPLAGKTLLFDIELVQIVDEPAESED